MSSSIEESDNDASMIYMYFRSSRCMKLLLFFFIFFTLIYFRTSKWTFDAWHVKTVYLKPIQFFKNFRITIQFLLWWRPVVLYTLHLYCSNWKMGKRSHMPGTLQEMRRDINYGISHRVSSLQGDPVTLIPTFCSFSFLRKEILIINILWIIFREAKSECCSYLLKVKVYSFSTVLISPVVANSSRHQKRLSFMLWNQVIQISPNQLKKRNHWQKKKSYRRYVENLIHPSVSSLNMKIIMNIFNDYNVWIENYSCGECKFRNLRCTFFYSYFVDVESYPKITEIKHDKKYKLIISFAEKKLGGKDQAKEERKGGERS